MGGMSGRETYLAERIDRRRERIETREMRQARRRHLSERASSLLLCEISEMPEEERPAYAELLCAAVRAQLVIHHGEASAAAILGREAHEAGRNLMPKSAARDVAEKVFRGAANDE
jgi:hypothetical protein